MTLYLDEGNTRIKAWWLVEGAPARSWQGDRAEDLLQVWPLRREAAIPVVVATVRDAANLLARLGAAGLPPGPRHIVAVNRGLMDTVYADAQSLGIDRWLAVLAVRERTPPGQPALVVDAGTAITVDLLTADGCHGGGYILPGLQLQLDALARHTQRVQVGQPCWTQTGLGQTTAECVSYGVLASVVGAIRQASEAAQRQTGQAPALWLTGGDAALLAAQLPAAHVDTGLVLSGMRAAARLQQPSA